MSKLNLIQSNFHKLHWTTLHKFALTKGRAPCIDFHFLIFPSFFRLVDMSVITPRAQVLENIKKFKFHLHS